MSRNKGRRSKVSADVAVQQDNHFSFEVWKKPWLIKIMFTEACESLDLQIDKAWRKTIEEVWDRRFSTAENRKLCLQEIKAGGIAWAGVKRVISV